MDDGILYVAKFNADGTGQWLPLTPDNPALAAWSLNDILINTRSSISRSRFSQSTRYWQAAATAVGHFPWFLTYNFLNDLLPVVSSGDDNALLLGLARSAVLGFSASCVSDCSSNSLRVIKTTKQTAQLSGEVKDDGSELSYPEVVKLIIEKDGVAGLFGRGLQTRLLTNAIQGAMFSILWKYFQQAA